MTATYPPDGHFGEPIAPARHDIQYSPSGRVVTATVVRPPLGGEPFVLMLPVAPEPPRRPSWLARLLLGRRST